MVNGNRVSGRTVVKLAAAGLIFVIAVLGPVSLLLWKFALTGFPQPLASFAIVVLAIDLAAGAAWLWHHFSGRTEETSRSKWSAFGRLAELCALTCTMVIAGYLVWFGLGFTMLLNSEGSPDYDSELWVPIERALFGPEATARSLNAIATGRINRHGNNAATLWCLENARKMIAGSGGIDSRFRAQLVNNLGRAYAIEGENDLALKQYLTTVTLATRDGNKVDEYELFFAACNIGMREAALGNFHLAVSAYELALGTQTAQTNNHIRAAINAQLAYALQSMGEYEGAKKCYELAIAFVEAKPAAWNGKRDDLSVLQSTISYAALLGEYRRLLERMNDTDGARVAAEKLNKYLAMGQGKP